MSLIYLIILAVSGLFVGALARLSLPGPDPMSLLATIARGLASPSASRRLEPAVLR